MTAIFQPALFVMENFQVRGKRGTLIFGEGKLASLPSVVDEVAGNGARVILVTGRHSLRSTGVLQRVKDLLAHLWIAAFVVGTAGTAALIRVMRANLLDELHKPYVVTARAKGLAEWKLVLKYPVRLALNPLVSTLGYLLPVLMSGSVIVSVVLALPTEGPLLLSSLLTEDMFVSAAIVLLLGTLTVIGTLLSDILLGILDPRSRLA